MPAYRGEHEKDLRPFIDAMRYKLANNKHAGKRKWEEDSIEVMLERLKKEVAEMEEAIKGGNTIEILMEAADIGNFAMMLAAIAINRAKNGDGSAPHGIFPVVDEIPIDPREERRGDPGAKSGPGSLIGPSPTTGLRAPDGGMDYGD